MMDSEIHKEGRREGAGICVSSYNGVATVGILRY